LQRGQDHFAAALVGGDDAHAAGEDDEQRVGLLALLHDGFAALEAALGDRVGDRFGLVGRQQGKQRHPADQLQVGQHRHVSNPPAGGSIMASYNRRIETPKHRHRARR
jgi:hypothetical protein